MKRLLREIFVIVSVFLLFFHTAYSIKHVQSQEETKYTIDFEIDDGQDLSSLFDGIDRFTQYGLAKVYKEVDGRIFYGLINTLGELVLEISYDAITDYDEHYYQLDFSDDEISRSGLASKKTGDIIVEPIYNWLGNIYEHEFFLLDYFVYEDGRLIRLQDLFYHQEEKIMKFELPSSYQINYFNYISVKDLHNGYFTLEISGTELLGGSEEFKQGGFNIFLVDKDFNLVNIEDVLEVFVYGDSMYVITQLIKEIEGELQNRQELWVGQTNGVSIDFIKIIEDAAFITYSNTDHSVFYIVNDGSWKSYKYYLETGEHELSLDERTFNVIGLSTLTFKWECDSVTRHCYYGAYDKDDKKFTKDFFKDYEIFNVNPFVDNLYRVSLADGKENLFKYNPENKENPILFLFDEGYLGWPNLQHNMLKIDRYESPKSYVSLYNIKDIDTSLSNSSERTLIYNQESRYIDYLGHYLTIQWSENNDRYTYIYNTQTNQYLFEESLLNASLGYEHDLLFGSYSKDGKREGFSYKDGFKFFDADYFESFNAFGYAKYRSGNVHGLINMAGESIIEGDRLDTYFNYDNNNNHIVISYNRTESTPTYSYYYIKENGDIQPKGSYDSVDFDGYTYLKTQKGDITKFFEHDSEMTDFNDEIEGASQISDLIDGVVLYEKEGTYYAIHVDGLNYELEIDAFVGRFVSKNGKVKYVGNNNALIEVDEEIVNSLNNLTHHNNHVYSITTDSGIALIIANVDSTSVTFERIDEITDKSINEIIKFKIEDYEMSTIPYGHHYKILVKDGDESFFGVLNNQGEIVVEPNYKSIQLREEFFVNYIASNYFELMHHKGGYMLDEQGNKLVVSSMTTLRNRFHHLMTQDNKDYTFIKDENEINYYRDVRISEIYDLENFYRISLSGDNNFIGIIDDDTNVIFDIDEGYTDYQLDIVNKYFLPYAFQSIDDNQVKIGGLYDFEGNKLLDKKYNEIPYDHDNRSIELDEGGFAIIGYGSADIHLWYLNDDSTEQHIYSMKDRFSMINESLVFGYPLNYIESFDDYFIVSKFVETDQIMNVAELKANNINQVFTKFDGENYYILEVVRGLFDNNYQKIIDFDDYYNIDFYERDPSLFKLTKQVEVDGDNLQVYGIYDGQGNELVPIEMSYIDYLSDWDLNILSNQKEGIYQLVDKNFKKVLSDGYPEMTYLDGLDIIILRTPYNLSDADQYEHSRDNLVGFYNLKSKLLVKPQFRNINEDQLKKYKQMAVEQIHSVKSVKEYCTDDDDEENNECYVETEYNKKNGIIDIDGNVLLPFEYDEISDFNEQGFAKFASIEYEEVVDDVTGEISNIEIRTLGLYHLDKGIVLLNDYSRFLSTTSREFNNLPPLFDKNNLIQIEKDEKIGLANKSGIVIEPLYEKAYFLDGKYYLKDFNGSWIIRESDKDDLIINLTESSVDIVSIQLAEEFIIIEKKDYNGFESYSNYSVLNMNLETHIPFGYSDIKFDGTYWYLERYNESVSGTEFGIWDRDLNPVVEFENKYDNLGEFVGGYAIGTSGFKPSNEDQDSGGIFDLFRFFTKVKAEEEGFVLDVLNEQGEVVSDLSSKFDSITLLGLDDDGDVKALVVIDGKYHLATMIKTEVEVQPVTVVSLNESEVELTPGGSFQLRATVLPENATNKNVTWTSSNSDIASVDENGKVVALKAGTTTITATAEDNGLYASAIVTVTQPVTGISLNNESLSLFVGNQATLIATVSPEDATDKSITWSSSDENIVSVDQEGNMIAKAKGHATITVTTLDGNHKATATVLISQPVSGIVLDHLDLNLSLNQVVTLIATVIPEDADNQAVEWNSENPTIATVNQDGQVTAVGFGETTITVKTVESGHEASVSVKVTQPVVGVSLNKENVNLSVGGNETLIVTIEPSDATNKNVTWTSSNTDIATVDQSGKVLALKVGTTTITATAEDNGLYANAIVTVIQPVESVSIDQDNLQLLVGKDTQLTATINPVDASNKDVTWTSSNESVATVDADGNVTALSVGETTITVTTADGNLTDSIKVEVIAYQPVQSIKLNKNSLELKVGQDETLIATVNPEDATNKVVIWSSSNENIATVNQNGKVVAKARGIVTITVTTEDGAFKASTAVTVTQPVLGITIDKTSVNLNIGANAQLTVTINPSNANNQSVTWSSSNTNVATVNNAGKVTAIGAGQVTITVTTVDGNKKATSLITVNQKDIDVLEVTGTRLVNGILTDLHINNTVSNFTNQIKAKDQNASVDIFNASGRLKLAGEKIVTGERIKVKLASGTVIEYTAAIKGDINGDGNINAADYVTLANHLLRKNNLSGAALVAAYIREKDTITVNAADYVALANHLLRKNPIHK